MKTIVLTDAELEALRAIVSYARDNLDEIASTEDVFISEEEVDTLEEKLYKK
jgi:hypothetical protein